MCLRLLNTVCIFNNCVCAFGGQAHYNFRWPIFLEPSCLLTVASTIKPTKATANSQFYSTHQKRRKIFPYVFLHTAQLCCKLAFMKKMVPSDNTEGIVRAIVLYYVFVRT